MAYPATINSIAAKSDGPSEIIYAAHPNEVRSALLDLVTALGNAPQGNKASVEARLDINIDDDGKLIGVGQTLFVSPSNTKYSTIQSAIDAISDMASAKPYTVLVFAGKYTEKVTMKAYVNVVGVSRTAVKLYAPSGQNALALHASDFENVRIYSSQAAPAVSCGSGANGTVRNCAIYSTGDDCISIDGGNPVFDHCYIRPTDQVYIDHNSGYPTFLFCRIVPSGGNGGSSADDMIIFYYCFIGSSENVYSVSAGAYAEIRFCILGEEFAGDGTKDYGTMSNTNTSPA